MPKSTRPKNTRTMYVDPRIVKFIKNIRESHYKLGKQKIKPLLDEYCIQENISQISESKIGKILKRYNLLYPPNTTKGIYHNPNRKRPKRKKKNRLKRDYIPKEAGDLIQIDTIVRFDMHIKRYVITAIDLKSRFAFATGFKRLSSNMALKFMKELVMIAPFDIKAVKTDNGLEEFHGEFDNYLKKRNITHYWSYPRTPKSNAHIERFNRTIQDEFIDENIIYLVDNNLEEFNRRLVEYLVFYNTVRPHYSL